jgi:multiple sugar transport system ATP-binding protein
MREMEKLRVEKLYKKFQEVEAVKKIDFQVGEGEFVVFLGPSGCGKTTTLRMIAGLEQPTSGKILIEGKDVTNLHASKRNIAFVFQSYALYPHMSIYENIAFPLIAQKQPREEIENKVKSVAKILKIEALLKLKPHQLSGGDMQKVALGRAMVRRPKLFLMDEPLSGLDAKHREEMRAELKRLHMEIGATTIYVTHDQLEAMSMADRIIIMSEGCIQQIGTPREVYLDPANTFVAHFIGSPGMNFIPLDYREEKSQFTFVDGSPLNHPLLQEIFQKKGTKKILLGIRPEFLRVGSEGDFKARVISTEPLGYKNLHALEIAGGNILRVEDPQRRKISGETWVQVDWDKACFFDQENGMRIR